MPFITGISCSYSVIFACSTEQFLHVVTAGVDKHVASAGVDEDVAATGVESSTMKFGSIIDSENKIKGLLSSS